MNILESGAILSKSGLKYLIPETQRSVNTRFGLLLIVKMGAIMKIGLMVYMLR